MEAATDKRQRLEGPPTAEQPAKQFDDLASSMDLSKCSVLNAVDAGMLKDVLQGSAGDEQRPVLRSDCDEQLLFGIVFTQPVRLQSIGVAAPSSAPRTIKLYANKDNMSFDDVEGVPATQVVTISATAQTVPLQFVKFQNVTSLTVFIEDNQADEEVTCVQRLTLVGDSIHKTNMNDLKKCG